jgi:hypothetical protein
MNILFTIRITLILTLLPGVILISQKNNKQPDFIIENINCSVDYLDGNDQTGMPVISRYKKVNVLAKIKNISLTDFFWTDLYCIYNNKV